MLEKTIIIKNRLGLHARPAAMLVQTVSRFKSRVKIFKGDQEVDGKSIMGIMTLAAAHGTNLRFIFDGEDEVQASDEIAKLVDSGFGES
jgi:phosphocarrier protein